MKKEILPIVIAGHIDHGKSTLIGRLLYETQSLPKEKLREIKAVSRQLGLDAGFAFCADQLKEERQKLMTIDTTQAFFNTRKRSYCIIDTPGHLEFLKNMITGVTYAEAAVLVVDANEGIKEQTRRHLYVIRLLGIRQVMAVLNKMDLVSYDREIFERLRKELFAIAKQMDMNSFIILPVSAKDNDNISRRTTRAKWFRGESLLQVLDSFSASALNTDKPLALPIQDIYEIYGEKILVGRLSSGRLKQGQKIKIAPDSDNATITKIITFDKSNKRLARAGENIGISLKEALDVKRGDVIIDLESPLAPTTNFKGNVLWFSREPLRINMNLDLVCATQKTPCVVEKIEKRLNTATLEIIEENAGALMLNESAQVSFKTERPVVLTKPTFIEELGRFLLEKDENIQAAGIVN